MFAIRYQLFRKVEPCDDEQLKIDIGAEIFDEIYLLKSMMKLNLDILHFENQCLKINHILNKNNLFLCIFELREKFRCLIKQDSERKNINKDLSLCIIEKFNGFNIIRIEFERKNMNIKNIKNAETDIIYKPVKKEDEIIKCFFTRQINLAYRSSFSENQKIKHSTA